MTRQRKRKRKGTRKTTPVFRAAKTSRPSTRRMRQKNRALRVPAIAFVLSMLRRPEGRTPVLLAAAATLSVCLFLVQVFVTSSHGFDVTELEVRADGIREENNQLAARASEMRSLHLIEERAEELGMIRDGQIVYLEPSDTEVALNR